MSANEDAYFKNGTVTVKDNASLISFSGRLYKLDANDVESLIGDAIGQLTNIK